MVKSKAPILYRRRTTKQLARKRNNVTTVKRTQRRMPQENQSGVIKKTQLQSNDSITRVAMICFLSCIQNPLGVRSPNVKPAMLQHISRQILWRRHLGQA